MTREATTPPAEAPVVQPEPALPGENVALVMRAFRAWRPTPEIGTPAVDDATARAFGEMIAEAWVADAKRVRAC